MIIFLTAVFFDNQAPCDQPKAAPNTSGLRGGLNIYLSGLLFQTIDC